MSRASDARFDLSHYNPAIKMEEIEPGDYGRRSRPLTGYATSQTPFEQNFYRFDSVVQLAPRPTELHEVRETLPSPFNYCRPPPPRSSSPSPSMGPESSGSHSTGAAVRISHLSAMNRPRVQPPLPPSRLAALTPRTGNVLNDFASGRTTFRAPGLSGPKLNSTTPIELGSTGQNPPPPSSRSSPPPLIEDTQHDQSRDKDADLNQLRPLLREYGDAKAVISQLRSVETLISAAGGYLNLRQLVRDRDTMQRKLNNGNPLENMEGFISEVQSLRLMNQRFPELHSEVEGPNGLRAKAFKYDILKQSLDQVKQTINTAYTKTKRSNPVPSTRPPVNVVHDTNFDEINRYAPPPRDYIGSSNVPGMNPARAQLIKSTTPQEDPNRDLYEAKLPAPSTKAKTGSNGIPLGKPRAQKSATPAKQDHSGAILKRKDPQDPFERVEKRLRPNDMPSLASGASIGPGYFSISSLPEGMGTSSTHEGTNVALSGVPQTVPHARYEEQNTTPDTRATTVMHLSSAEGSASTTPEVEEARGIRFLCGLDMMSFVPKGFAPRYSGGMMPYSVGLWSNMQYKVPNWGEKEIKSLRTKIPHELGVYLVEKILSNITSTNVQRWNTMLEGGDQCIVSYILHGPKPSRGGRIYHACEECSLRVRPCALLKNVHGVPTLIILPLSATVRQSQDWSDKKFWLADRN